MLLVALFLSSPASHAAGLGAVAEDSLPLRRNLGGTGRLALHVVSRRTTATLHLHGGGIFRRSLALDLALQSLGQLSIGSVHMLLRLGVSLRATHLVVPGDIAGAWPGVVWAFNAGIWLLLLLVVMVRVF